MLTHNPKKIVAIAALWILTVLSSSCSSLQKIGLSATSDLLYKGGNSIKLEENWNNFKVGTLANLQMIEGLHFLHPTNENFLLTLLKGYSAYAFGVNETLYIDDYFAENNRQEHKDQAIYNYSKAMAYGEKLWEEKELDFSEVLRRSSSDNDGPNSLANYLDKKLSSDVPDIEAIFFMAQALGGLINLQKEKIHMVALATTMKGMMDWACNKRPELNYGACQLFSAAMLVSRPKMLGGDPEQGKKIFLEAIAKWPDNLLLRVSFLQFYAIPMSDEDAYKGQQKEIEAGLKQHLGKMVWAYQSKKNLGSENKIPDDLKLFNAIAIKRYELITKFEKDFF
ncbi:MAG: hypothetical protein A2504_03565 [Bdellovibrionales bacterium RIFOXYD12_FULL_39_22]|nr:MAG: hypothetical protein A2385_11315 [Bdellovibrionales bacterium RIFOXYB1_FULL_39_21]OFZ41658.1 MAG: hypothetical protein A2485_01625 [Bdellovibrionales bacterium RIFOXYC12_FULL_39_17]OFZ46058.1 MAG: hypothetical protein A2404_11990 [Bdellovibrionales bacterium RIFOXYC1_FULL_39_130]OFZ74885.1 MAG: hypothetical protein A2560_15030 [Bdellovibrionales bacterium RIFOXYD1_FULL_39_84]OFZ92738.1 MAG: hypothetical protein A2504_03565 [Bdellovibrionales bacterium RIFOXYD12_FULL_39_22]HLE12519.1 TR